MLRPALAIAALIIAAWLGAVQLASSAAYGDLAVRPSLPAALHDRAPRLLRPLLGDARARAAAAIHEGDLATAAPPDRNAARRRAKRGPARPHRASRGRPRRRGGVLRASRRRRARANPDRRARAATIPRARWRTRNASSPPSTTTRAQARSRAKPGGAWASCKPPQATATPRAARHTGAPRETSYERALTLAPNEETYLLAAGYQSLANGDAQASERFYAHAAEVVPNSADAYAGLAWTAAARRDCARARTNLANARALRARDDRHAALTRSHRRPDRRARALTRCTSVIVALDTQLAVGTATGIGVYERDLAAALRNEGVDVRELRAPRLDPWRFDRRVLWDQVLLPRQAARSGATLLHAASRNDAPAAHAADGRHGARSRLAPRPSAHASYARAYFGKLQSRAYKSAAAIICDSPFSANEYHALIDPNAHIDVVHPGVDPRFATLDRRPEETPFALVTGTVEARKNLEVLIEALPHVPGLRIISAGPPTPYADTIRARARGAARRRPNRAARLRPARRPRRPVRARNLRARPVTIRRFRLRPRGGDVRRRARHRRPLVIADRSGRRQRSR